ncbi:basic leucine zipper 61-like [Rhododendron vialii]|uniref:basic leucine zipper 61-like n=1 Tax=Rhododendron vialii TaxID=182163 RepID=UPI00265E8BC0|nr:basic leucine zipper 61-like [Rhododendron vialii]
MAHLPPKAPPNMTQNWHSLPFQMMQITSNTTTTAAATPPPSWVDEFLDFSSVRRTAYRRSETDSIAFLPLLEECPTSPPPRTAVHGGGADGFERLNDEQLMSMFADEVAVEVVGPTASSSDPTTPSDHNTNDEEKPRLPQDHQKKRPKEEPREVQDGSCKSDPPTTKPSKNAAGGDTVVDPKRIKRILANRQSAQRSRVRKLQYISELERSVTSLQSEVSALSPRVAFFDHQRLILNVDNSTLKQRIAALVQDKIFKDAHQEALRKEIERLTQVYREQNNKEMATSQDICSADKDQLLNTEEKYADKYREGDERE